MNAFDLSHLRPGSFSLASEGVVHRSVSSSGGRTSCVAIAVESFCSAAHQEISCVGVADSSVLKVTKQLVYKAGLLKEVAEVVAL